MPLRAPAERPGSPALAAPAVTSARAGDSGPGRRMPLAAAAPAAGTRLSQGSRRWEAGAARGGDAAPGDPAWAEGEQAAPAPCVLHGQISGAAADAGSGTEAAWLGLRAALGPHCPRSGQRSPPLPRPGQVAVGSPSGLRRGTGTVPAAPGGSRRSLAVTRGTLRCAKLCESQRSHLI